MLVWLDGSDSRFSERGSRTSDRRQRDQRHRQWRNALSTGNGTMELPTALSFIKTRAFIFGNASKKIRELKGT